MIPLTIATADYILDFGPQAGEHGGHVTAQGTSNQIKRNQHSLTGAYLSGKEAIPLPEIRRETYGESLTIENASVNNLKMINVEIPIGVLTCLTGVSGSGKSTLMHQLLLPAAGQALAMHKESSEIIYYKDAKISDLSRFDKVISIDQNPIGHTVRSDVGTYVDLLGRMREFFASLPLSRTKGLQGKHFSYNHRRGMCTDAGAWATKKLKCIFFLLFGFYARIARACG